MKIAKKIDLLCSVCDTDSSVGYAFAQKWSASITVNNLFDKVYYAWIPSSYYGLYGDPRNAMLTISKSS